jgi:hypothetical protein
MPDVTPLPPELLRSVSALARALVAAARAWTLYPPEHPALRAALDRLASSARELNSEKPLRLVATPETLVVLDTPIPAGDQAVRELAGLLHRHLVGSLSISAGADLDSWQALLGMLARPPEQLRAEGGIAQLWSAAGRGGIEIREIDYAEVLRDKQGQEVTIDAIIAAALGGPQLQLDTESLEALLALIEDPVKLDELMARLDEATPGEEVEARTAAVMNLLRTAVTQAQSLGAEPLEATLQQLAKVASRLSAGEMVELLSERASRTTDGDIAGAVISRMDDEAIAQFVAGSISTEQGATARLATAFQALVPDVDRRRHLIGIAEEKLDESDTEQQASLEELRGQVQSMVSTYSDASYVSDAYAQELFKAQTRATEIERTTDDPPERISGWLATVNDDALPRLDQQLMQDLLVIEEDAARWRDVADTAAGQVEHLVRDGRTAQALELTDTMVAEAARLPVRTPMLEAVMQKLARGTLLKSIPPYLRGADDDGVKRFERLCHAIGTPVIGPLAEALSTEQDARSRRRLRDILVSFGAAGRDVVQQLMQSANWEVRRTAAHLLREFGGTSGLPELRPLLSDAEPLVQREALQALVTHGSREAAGILLEALDATAGRTRQSLGKEMTGLRDPRAAPLLCHVVTQLDQRRHPDLYVAALEALGAFKDDQAIEPLKVALHAGEWWAPGRSRRARTAAAAALRRIGSPRAVEALRAAAASGGRGTRAAARAELTHLG